MCFDSLCMSPQGPDNILRKGIDFLCTAESTWLSIFVSSEAVADRQPVGMVLRFDHPEELIVRQTRRDRRSQILTDRDVSESAERSFRLLNIQRTY
jgi:hypothetical protein